MILLPSNIPENELWEPALEINLHTDSHVFSDSVINISILLLVIRFQNLLSFKTSPVSKPPEFQNLTSFKTCHSWLFLPMSFHSISHHILLILLENIYPSILQVSQALVTSHLAYLNSLWTGLPACVSPTSHPGYQHWYPKRMHAERTPMIKTLKHCSEDSNLPQL